MRRLTRNFAGIAALATPMRRAAGKAGCVLMFERFWRRFLPLLLLFMVFAACCWLNLFAIMPPVLHIMLLVIFAVAFIAAAVFLCFLRRPTQAEIQARLEHDNALHYGQLGLGRATLAGPVLPETRALWRAHKKRMQAQLGKLHLRPPRPNIPAYDHFALRSIVFLVFAVTFCFQLGGSGGRLGDAFYFGPRQPGTMRLDAWISPPDYTGRPPVYLLSGGENFQSGGAAASDKDNAADAAAISVPQGSKLTLRLNDNGRGLAAMRCAGPGFKTRLQPQRAGANSVYQLQLVRSATCTLSSPVLTKSWVFAVEPDQAPVIRWVKPPERALNGMLKLNYAVYDDYGIKKAWAEIEPADKQAQAAAYPYFARLTGPAQISHYQGGKLIALQGVELNKAAEAAGPAPAPLFPPPQIALNVPRPLPAENEARRGGTAVTEADLTKNPWAGAFVTMRLVAEDGAGNKAVSAPISLILPQKTFINPLSRALIEQRRLLAENIQAAPRLLDMLSALLLRPEKTIADKGAVLALYSLRARLKYALQPWPRQDVVPLRRQELRDVTAYMWAIAEGMDSGRLAEAERRLALASQALREALRNGASEEEIARLMQDLRNAMQDYIAMLAERGQENADNTGQKAPVLGESELEKRLKALEDAAKQGNRGRGEELLAEFENLMKNLQVTKGEQGSGIAGGRSSQHSKMQQQMDNLSDIMRRQQQLLDETHKLREQNWREQSAEAPERDKQRQDLQQRQGALQRDLQDLQRQLETQGLSPKNDFKEAEQQMGESGQALKQGDERRAVETQAQILQSLRDGAQNIMGQMREALKKADEAQQAQQNGKQGEGGGQDTASGLAGGGREQKNGAQDPLGRPAGTGQAGQDMFIPQEEAGQRARRILEEIRKKLGNLTPQQEKDYLERLLNFE